VRIVATSPGRELRRRQSECLMPLNTESPLWRRGAESEDAMVFVRLLDEQQPDKYETIYIEGGTRRPISKKRKKLQRKANCDWGRCASEELLRGAQN
jgi:hypothetical protein